MEYKESDFTSCMFNPMVKKNMLDVYPRLIEATLPEWMDENIDGLIRYMIMVYDPKSPLFRNERDLNYRKGLAADLAKLNMSEEIVNELTNESFIQTVYNSSHPYLVDLIIKFLIRFIKSKEFAAIVIVESCFWESSKLLMEPIYGKDSKTQLEAVQKKSAIKDELDKDITRLNKYQNEFFGEDEQLETLAKGRMTPEKYARLQKSTTEPL